MNTILVFSAVCIGLASAGAHHAYHSGGYNSGGYSSGGGQQLVDVPYTVEIRNIGSSSSSGGSGRSYGGSSNSGVGRSYQYQQQQPQIQIQRSQPVQSFSYSQPQQRRQSQQLVDVPYSVETRTVSRGSSGGGNYGGGRSYQQQPQVQIQRSQPVQSFSYSQPQQQRRQQQLVDVPYTVQTSQRSSGRSSSSGARYLSSNVGSSIQYQSTPVVQAVSLVPVSVASVGTPVVFGSGGVSGLSSVSIGTLGGSSAIVSPQSYVIY